jgi:hypothetical protein
MKLKIIFLLFLAATGYRSNAQWLIQPGVGMAIPLTGYSKLVKNGVLLQFDAMRRLHNPRWGIGLMLGWARMHDDDEPSDGFRDARLDQIPILATVDHQFRGKKIAPYVGLGLGVSLYNFNYVPTLGSGETVFNASFSMMPRLGIRKSVDEKFAPFFEVNCPLVMDGPPVGVSEGEKATGYVGLAIGVAYHF